MLLKNSYGKPYWTSFFPMMKLFWGPPICQAVATTGFDGETFKKRTILFRFCALAASRNCSATSRLRRSFSRVNPIRCFSSENSASTLLRAPSGMDECWSVYQRPRTVPRGLVPTHTQFPRFAVRAF